MFEHLDDNDEHDEAIVLMELAQIVVDGDEIDELDEIEVLDEILSL